MNIWMDSSDYPSASLRNAIPFAIRSPVVLILGERGTGKRFVANYIASKTGAQIVPEAHTESHGEHKLRIVRKEPIIFTTSNYPEFARNVDPFVQFHINMTLVMPSLRTLEYKTRMRLVHKLLAELNREYSRTTTIIDNAAAWLAAQLMPGNIAEMKATITVAMLNAHEIDLSSFLVPVNMQVINLEMNERLLMMEAIKISRTSDSAADRLGISYPTFMKKRQQYGL